MPDEKKDDAVATLQAEFARVNAELILRVNEFREMKDTVETRIAQGLKTASGTIEAEIVKLRAEQEQLRAKLAAPPVIDTDETRKKSLAAQRRALVEGFRFLAGMRGKLTDQEKDLLVGKDEKKRALVEDATGQILVTEDVLTEIFTAAEKFATIRPNATVRTTNKDRQRNRTVGRVTMTYGTKLELGGVAPKSAPVPTEDYLYVEDMRGIVQVGEDELEDADPDLEGIIMAEIARAVRETEETKFIQGAGHASLEPEGLCAGTTIERVTAAGAAAITFEDLMDLMYGTGTSAPLKPVYQRAGIFLMHPYTELAVMKLHDLQDQYIWQPAVSQGLPNTLWGRPIFTGTDWDTIVHSADIVFFGDLRSCYRILDRRELRIQRLVELYAEAGYIGFKATIRNTGGIVNAEAARILQNA